MVNDYDKYNRNEKATAFYQSPEWRKMRNYIFNFRDKGLCQMCLDKNEIAVGDVVHHKTELLDGDRGWKLRLDKDNLITLCHRHHNQIHKGGGYGSIVDGMMFDADGNIVEVYEGRLSYASCGRRNLEQD